MGRIVSRSARKRRKAKAARSVKAPAFLARVLCVDLRPGEVAQVVVAHEKSCLQLRGGRCTCVPDLTMQRGDGRLSDVDAEGIMGEGRVPS